MRVDEKSPFLARYPALDCSRGNTLLLIYCVYGNGQPAARVSKRLSQPGEQRTQAKRGIIAPAFRHNGRRREGLFRLRSRCVVPFSAGCCCRRFVPPPYAPVSLPRLIAWPRRTGSTSRGASHSRGYSWMNVRVGAPEHVRGVRKVREWGWGDPATPHAQKRKAPLITPKTSCTHLGGPCAIVSSSRRVLDARFTTTPGTGASKDENTMCVLLHDKYSRSWSTLHPCRTSKSLSYCFFFGFR